MREIAIRKERVAVLRKSANVASGKRCGRPVAAGKLREIT
jgi:hypothetical protein